MPNILRNMRIKRVAFVDEGANPHAHIRFAKNKEPEADAVPDKEVEKGVIKRVISTLAKAFGIDDQPVTKDDNTDPAPQADETPVNQVDKVKNDNVRKGAKQEMEFNKFDESKMTTEDKAQFDEMKKKYGVVATDTEPSAEQTRPVSEQQAEPPAAANTDDVYKGISPEVKAELERLRKFREDTEDAQLLAIAKKYELLGRKPEELAPVLKSLKSAGETAYNDMIGLMDANLEAVEKSGLFSEFGKRGADTESDPWVKIELAATEIVKSKPDLRWADAIDLACGQNPELLAAYEKSRH